LTFPDTQSNWPRTILSLGLLFLGVVGGWIGVMMKGRHQTETGAQEALNVMDPREKGLIHTKDALDDEDKTLITEIFFDDIIPKLKKMHARIGTINCDFAGEQYKNWVIHFRSTRLGFDIIDFEYDKESRSYKLAP
jgi:hypothetical protein